MKIQADMSNKVLVTYIEPIRKTWNKQNKNMLAKANRNSKVRKTKTGFIHR
jgi:hypothetical protein